MKLLLSLLEHVAQKHAAGLGAQGSERSPGFLQAQEATNLEQQSAISGISQSYTRHNNGTLNNAKHDARRRHKLHTQQQDSDCVLQTTEAGSPRLPTGDMSLVHYDGWTLQVPCDKRR